MVYTAIIVQMMKYADEHKPFPKAPKKPKKKKLCGQTSTS